MGILDDLREETERKRLIEGHEALRTEQLEKNYQQKLLPKMQDIYKFFKEMVEHLQYLQEPVQIENYTTKYSQMGTLEQKDYKLSTDNHGGITHIDSLKDIYLRFNCRGDEPFEYEVKNQAEIEQQVNFLSSKKVPFEWSRNSGTVEKNTATFIIEKKVPITIHFFVDFEQSKINLNIHNHHNFGRIQRSYHNFDINEHFLDQLARFLLRKSSEFVESDISDSEREAIRKKLNSDHDYNSTHTPQEKKSKKGLFNKIGSIFK